MRVVGFGVFASAVIVALTLVVLRPVAATHRQDEAILRHDVPLQLESARLRDSLVAWHLFLEPKFDQSEAGAAFPPKDISLGGQLSLAQSDRANELAAALRAHGLRADADHLDVAMKALAASITNLAPLVTGANLTQSKLAALIAGERASFATVWDVTSSLSKAIAQEAVSDAQVAKDQASAAEVTLVLSGFVIFSLTLGATFASARRAMHVQRNARLDERRQVFAAELQEALEFTETERAVYNIVGQSLTDAVPDLHVELLIADSSRAHFSRVLTSHDDAEGAEGCGVVSPRDCPAAKRAHTLRFASSDAINACPYLKNRPSGSCSAACIPVSIAGQGVGVMHATGSNGIVPTTSDVEKMEFSARRTADRVALIRTFETSETQARTDPLTGLLNRRSLENRVRELQSDGIPYALAYGDLDFFKTLNDTHGHEAGDQALRLFSRIMRDSVRPADLVSRYGGEEFVIVLPDCSTETATGVLERLRERLALSLTGGRVPAFTVSFGLGSSADADTFEEVVAVADQALLAAKAAGRNRVIVANDTDGLLPSPTDASLGRGSLGDGPLPFEDRERCNVPGDA
jgi:diguanylate cyclase (GGDEF)-like protein